MFDKIYRHQLDAKNRMRIPAKFKEELGENYTITIGAGGCLAVYTEKEMSELKEKLNKISVFDAEAQKPLRILMAYSWDAEEDSHGRILIPEDLRKYAKFQKDLVVIKNLKCIEIWASEVWDKYIADFDFDFKSLQNAIDKLG